jgi:acetyl-CoA acetyltransferase
MVTVVHRTMTPDVAIVGLGMTELGKVFGRSAAEFAAQAVRRAARDAGVDLTEIDGLLVSAGMSRSVGVDLNRTLGLRDLSLLAQVQSFGASAGVMVSMAAQAIEGGNATTVACVFADTPLKPGGRTGDAYNRRRRRPLAGLAALPTVTGLNNATAAYALAARRHMIEYGTTSEQFGAVAVSTRAWAAMNPLAQMRAPMTIQDHQASRWVVDPLHLLDCCLVTNGAICVIVTQGERARDLRHPPVRVLGWGQSHPGYRDEAGSQFGLTTGAKLSGQRAMAMAGVTPEQIDIREIYDCYTYTTVVSLEDYGFCAKGEGGHLAESGALGPGGALPTNTGGGQLSSYYMWGMTPLSEAVIQARGEAGERQVSPHDLILVSGNGGVLDYHATLILAGAS